MLQGWLEERRNARQQKEEEDAAEAQRRQALARLIEHRRIIREVREQRKEANKRRD